jgi:hypothetical protein
MRFGLARLMAGLLVIAAISALRPTDLRAAGSGITITWPKTGSTVSGTITVKVQAAEELAFDYLIIGIDDDRPFSSNSEAYRVELDTTQYADGVHYLWAEAFTTASRVAASPKVKVIVSNGNRPAPPPMQPEWAAATTPPEPMAADVEPTAAIAPAGSAPLVEPKPKPGAAQPASPAPGHLVEAKPAEPQRALSVVVMGRRLQSDVAPSMSRGRVLVGFRAVLEGIGATVDWRADARVASALREGRKVEVTIGSKLARVDGREVLLDTPAHITQDRTIVPLRFCADAYGYEVAWRSANRRAELYAAELSASSGHSETPE